MFPWWWSMTSQAQKCGSWNLSVCDEQRGVGIPHLWKLYEVLTLFPPCLLLIWTVLVELWRKPSFLPFPVCIYCLVIGFKIQLLPKAIWSSFGCQLSPIESGWRPYPTLEVAQGSDATLPIDPGVSGPGSALLFSTGWVHISSPSSQLLPFSLGMVVIKNPTSWDCGEFKWTNLGTE